MQPRQWEDTRIADYVIGFEARRINLAFNQKETYFWRLGWEVADKYWEVGDKYLDGEPTRYRTGRDT
jgi:hypothetical protein